MALSMWSKVLQIIVVCSALTGPAFAQDAGEGPKPQFTILDQRQPAPFRGTLFDPAATAYLLTLQERLRAEYVLELGYKIGELSAEHQLEITNLDLRYNALSDEYQLRIQAKDMEIDQLNQSLAKLSRNDRHWFVIGGFAIGVGLTAGIVAAINGAAN